MNRSYKAGDTAGYVVLVLDRYRPENWNTTLSGIYPNTSQALAAVNVFESEQEGTEYRDTFAVGRVDLAMISRPS
jgi:hypothetical protein